MRDRAWQQTPPETNSNRQFISTATHWGSFLIEKEDQQIIAVHL
ncbi:MAG: hypothetical protein R3F53_23350 [Gammaproteobacteria bacterium]